LDFSGKYESKARGKTVWVALLSLETCLCSCHMQRALPACNVASANNILIFIYIFFFILGLFIQPCHARQGT